MTYSRKDLNLSLLVCSKIRLLYSRNSTDVLFIKEISPVNFEDIYHFRVIIYVEKSDMPKFYT